ncbi:MAG TPA: PAS domain S-box protein [Edaphobacter sp.]|jgi:PAS domain S-box-containing protein|nr:PAS domain S-box protein [Edaphobacter sp.]
MQNLHSESYRWKDDLENSESDLERLFVGSAIGMALLDEEGCFLSANEMFCRTLGYSAEELLNMKWGQLLLAHGSLLLHEKTNLLSWQAEQVLLRKDRSQMPARVWISSLRETPLHDSVSLMIIEDITEQRDAEFELSKRKTEIEKLASQLIQSQETERKRLARELHDDIGQRLSLVASEVALMASQSSIEKAATPNRLDHLREELDSLCTDIHEISHDLHSYKLQHLGLKSALKDLCRRFTQPNFQVRLDIDDMDEPNSKDVSLCLYRVVQEALNNALRHAHAFVVAITVTSSRGMFYMAIQDTGVGFERSASPQGLGLISMTERLRLVRGDLKLNSILGRGTEIWVSIPDTKDNLEIAGTDQVFGDPSGSINRSEVA